MDPSDGPGSQEAVEGDPQPIREYHIVYDLLENTEKLVGAEDFYGRPTPNGYVGAGELAAAVHPDDVESFLDVLMQMAAMGPDETINFGMRMLHVDGRYVRSRYVIRAASYGPNGKPSRVIIRVRWMGFEPN
jgi:hypothetical protein